MRQPEYNQTEAATLSDAEVIKMTGFLLVEDEHLTRHRMENPTDEPKTNYEAGIEEALITMLAEIVRRSGVSTAHLEQPTKMQGMCAMCGRDEQSLDKDGHCARCREVWNS